MTNTGDDAWKIVDSAENGSGLEALRLVVKRYDPKNPGMKRSILMNLMTVQSSKKITDLEKTILYVENLIKKYEGMSEKSERLPNDLVATILINVCHKELRDFLELQTKEMDRAAIRSEIFNYIERKRKRTGDNFHALKIAAMNEHQEEESWDTGDYGWYWNEPQSEYLEELHYFGDKGGRKGAWKDFWQGFSLGLQGQR